MPRVLLIHGLSSSPAALWGVRRWFEDADWTAEAVALRGHGGQHPADDYALPSYAADLAATGPWDAVVAHSLGATAATLVAAADPGWTARLVLLEPVWRITAEDQPAIIADQRAELALTRPRLEAEKPHWDPRDIDAKLSSIAHVDPEAVTRTFTDTVHLDAPDATRELLLDWMSQAP